MTISKSNTKSNKRNSLCGGNATEATLSAQVQGVTVSKWQYKNSSGNWADYPTTSDNTNITSKALVKGGKVFHREVLFWAGYTYRQWHFITGETSKEIYKQANAAAMNTNYYGYHTVDVNVAIDWFKEKNKK